MTPQTQVQAPVRALLIAVLEDAYEYRLPDGCCARCAGSDTGRCGDHQEDQDRAARYAAVLTAVESAPDDRHAVAALTGETG